MSLKLESIAVLIDADNASANNIGEILKEIAKHGHIACKKIYGDWGNVHIKSWQDALLKYAIDPMQQFAYVKGKNATDIGMVIEAMDLLYSGNYDGFCIVSSDSDFTSLSLRIRKNHIKVFGFGKRSTVSAFTQACDRFFYVEDLLVALPEPSVASSPTRSVNKTINNVQTQWTTKQLQTQTHLISLLTKLIKDDPNSNDGWSDISFIAREISQNHKNVKLIKYGYAKFSTLIIALRLYDIRRQKNGVWIKPKSQKDLLATENKAKSSQSKLTVKPNISNSDSSLFSSSTIIIKIITAPTIDLVLFRVDAKERVRGDEDMIFYGQTHSEDGSIELNQQLIDNKSIFEFSCDLGAQNSAINQLNFALSGELDRLDLYLKHAPIEVSIVNTQDNNVLFSGEFNIDNKTSKSLLLFTLSRENNQWRFVPKHQSIDGDLGYLCKKYGVEISDD